MITDGHRFCNIKETDDNHLRWQLFRFRFNSSAEIERNQLNFNCKIIVFSRILSELFLVYAIIRLIRISAELFLSHPCFQIAYWGSTFRRIKIRSRLCVKRKTRTTFRRLIQSVLRWKQKRNDCARRQCTYRLKDDVADVLIRS